MLPYYLALFEVVCTEVHCIHSLILQQSCPLGRTRSGSVHVGNPNNLQVVAIVTILQNYPNSNASPFVFICNAHWKNKISSFVLNLVYVKLCIKLKSKTNNARNRL